MKWIVYTLACMFLYGIMQFFIKLSSAENPIVYSMLFILVQFLVQIVIGVFLITKKGLIIDFGDIRYVIAAGISAAIATIMLYIALESEPLSKVVPITNMSLLIAVVLGMIFLKEPINLKIIIGIIFAVVSIYLLTRP